MATLRSVFKYVAIIAPTSSLLRDRGANFVLVGAQRAVPPSEIQARFAARSDRETILVDDLTERLVGKAPVLTDDLAPIDELLMDR